MNKPKKAPEKTDPIIMPELINQVRILKKCNAHNSNTNRKMYISEDLEYLDIDKLTVEGEFLKTENNLRRHQRVMVKTLANHNEQWDDIERKELTLNRTFKKFHKFVRSNLMKRERVMERSRYNLGLTEKRIKDIEHLKLQVISLRNAQQQMKTMIKKHDIYPQYLISVISRSDQYASLNNLLDRYDVLITTNEARSDFNLKLFNEYWKISENFSKMILEKFATYRKMLEILNSLETRYQTLLKRVIKIERQIDMVRGESEKLLVDIRTAIVAAYSIYQHMCAKQGIDATLPKTDYVGHLLHIKKTLEILLQAQREVK